MQDYIRKLEEENKKLIELQENNILGVPVMPRLENLLLLFGTEYSFEGHVDALEATLMHLYVNELTGSDDKKQIKSYKTNTKINVNSWSSNDNMCVREMFSNIMEDLKGFYNVSLFDFKFPFYKTLTVAPWHLSTSMQLNSLVVTEWDSTVLHDMFFKGEAFSMKIPKRVTRWTRFKQFLKGI